MSNPAQSANVQHNLIVTFVFRGREYSKEFEENATILDLVNHIEQTFDIDPTDQSFLLKRAGRLRSPFQSLGTVRLRDYANTKIRVLGLPRNEVNQIRDSEDLYNAGVLGPTDEDPFDWDVYRANVGSDDDSLEEEEINEVQEVPEDSQGILPPAWRSDLTAIEQLARRLRISLRSLPNPYFELRSILQTAFESPNIPILNCSHVDDDSDVSYNKETPSCICVNVFLYKWFWCIRALLNNMNVEFTRQYISGTNRQSQSIFQSHSTEEFTRSEKLILAVERKLELLRIEHQAGIGSISCGALYSELALIFRTVIVNTSHSDLLPDHIYQNVASLIVATEILELEDFLRIPPNYEPQR